MTEIYLSLGSNIGDRVANIKAAVELLDTRMGTVHESLSSLIETEAWGFCTPDKFINAVVVYKVPLLPDTDSALALLQACKDVERSLGRTDKPEYDSAGNRIYHSRTIDIDILFFGFFECDISELTIPHKLMKERDFVMIPLREIASDSIKDAFPQIFA